MRSWLFAFACVACSGNSNTGTGLGGVHDVELTAGSNQCGADYAPFASSARTISINGSGVVVSGSGTMIPAADATDVTSDGSDISFSVQWQIGMGGESGRTTGHETYSLSGNATQLSGSATGTYEIEAFPACTLALNVTPT